MNEHRLRVRWVVFAAVVVGTASPTALQPQLQSRPRSDLADRFKQLERNGEPAIPGALFQRVEIPGYTDIVEGNNGIALADLNHDGLVDLVATYTEPKRGLSASGHHLRVFVNQGELRFQPHTITIRDSQLRQGERIS